MTSRQYGAPALPSTTTTSSSPLTNFRHRLPTVSAADALYDEQSPPPGRYLTTGLAPLDCALRPPEIAGNLGTLTYSEERKRGGVLKGQVTEIYGPPGVGKTALGLQLARGAIMDGGHVVWIDAGHRLPAPRLKTFLSEVNQQGDSSSTEENLNRTPGDLMARLSHFDTPTLPHFVALLCHTTTTFPPASTSLIVIDSLSSLISATYAKSADTGPVPRKSGNAFKQDPRLWAASRKWSVLQYITTSLQKLAAINDIAIVLLNQAATKMHPDSGAVVQPAIFSIAWDAAMASRVVLFRDWGWQKKQIRYAAVLKASGAVMGADISARAIVPFTIEVDGLKVAIMTDTDSFVNSNTFSPQQQLRKRKANDLEPAEDEPGFDISDGDFDWVEDDDLELSPHPPRQRWQGSEDVLVPDEEDSEDLDNRNDREGDEHEE